MTIIGSLLLSLLLLLPGMQPMDEHAHFDAFPVDGPYVVYRGDTTLVHFVDSTPTGKKLRTLAYQGTKVAKDVLVVNTDEPGKSFTVKLKERHKPEKAEYGRPSKMLVMSDLEGNFSAFRKLLQAGGVINDAYEWTFGDGHLVLIGDMVDRGDMVTELLWLIYSLEQQAEEAKGKVHFVLGNHELMNMTGDLRYLHPRYQDHARLMDVHFMSLMGPDSEFGQWLASKNIAERVGNMFFVHGGISPDVIRMSMSVSEMNNLARPWYFDTAFVYPDARLNIIMGDDGPMWYRGFYNKAAPIETGHIDAALMLYQVRHIVTGHTIIDESIVSVRGGRLINTDVHHSKGHSEALLVEKRDMWRITPDGKKLAVESK